ncbi:sugar phosphate isomerase/epimerase family protein [Vibrio sp. VB16]|uniref:sugar phosphate isomerase/epimerase family protein n=1 Tax=Vibrio sp. VB16 TaxID=2785746 RepID=UPI0018A01927|nr:TIM barrel protein [Vibrio sp. VB16]UGA57361.1 TIM barrel protein [Vibrio sp. VB16]
MIYLSTGGFSKKSFIEVSRLLDCNVIKGLELSSGKHTPNLQVDLDEVRKNYKVALHNYFPVPKEAFVFNLASLDPEISEKSLEHAKYAIELSAKVGSSHYSFHAGYLIDPQVNELGRQIKERKLNARNVGLKQFINNVNELAEFAKQYDVGLMIENNVLSLKNSQAFHSNPLLMVDEADTEEIFSQIKGNVGLLVDFAHLKVSANSLKFSAENYLKKFHSITKGYHLSDNDGKEDTNNSFDLSAWFLDGMRKDLDYYSIEVYDGNISKLHQQYEFIESFLRE